MHGMYQRLLRSLAESGVLIAIASKNNPPVVLDAFRRDDLLLPADWVFPMEIHWEPKSESIARILSAWNISADSVVFVDDSVREVEEVQQAFPDLQCIKFPCGDDQAIYELLEKLRDLFGKPRISVEDGIRLQTIRNGQSHRVRTDAVYHGTGQSFEQIGGTITFEFSKDPPDPRALELINKTNQFNLNGNRYTEGAWLNYIHHPETFLAVVSYRDRFGSLGKIAVLTGHSAENTLFVNNWAMSCRAFGRRIEDKCLDQLFERYGPTEIVFDFLPTLKNSPIADFFSQFLATVPKGSFRLCEQAFRDRSLQVSRAIKAADLMSSRVS